MNVGPSHYTSLCSGLYNSSIVIASYFHHIICLFLVISTQSQFMYTHDRKASLKIKKMLANYVEWCKCSHNSSHTHSFLPFCSWTTRSVGWLVCWPFFCILFFYLPRAYFIHSGFDQFNEIQRITVTNIYTQANLHLLSNHVERTMQLLLFPSLFIRTQSNSQS